MIQKIIHQTWKTDNIPKQAISTVDSWKRLNPDWEYRLWTDSDNAELCKNKFPEIWEAYKKYPFAIQRADAIRYMILCEHGGLYSDIDIECIKSVDELLQGVSVALFSWKHAVTNNLMAAEKNSDFFHFVISRLNDAFTQNVALRNTVRCIFNTTGIQFLTECYNATAVKPVLLSEVGYVVNRGIPFQNMATRGGNLE